jgi:thermopsin
MNSQFSGWFTSFLNGFPASNLIVWNSTSTLVAYNNFKGMGQSMLMYGGSGNMIFGNYFQQAASVAQPSALELGGTPIGLSMYSSGNTIINNNFNVYVTVYSPQYSIYYPPGVFVAYTVYYNNTYNITAVPSSTVLHFNGYSLTGSVVNQGFISGNTYWDAVQGQAYNDYGLIASGGDFSPVFPILYNVTVQISNLPVNSTAFVYLIQNGYQGYLFSSSGSSNITVPAYNGTYYVMVVTSTGQYFSFPNTITVNGANISVNVSI